MTDHAARLVRQLELELPGAVRLRRHLHAYPYRSGEEGPTLVTLLATLPGVVTPVADTGAVVRVGGPGPAVAVRAELDALSIKEMSGRDWSSVHEGTMHACGHDIHMAALVALARAVHQVGGPAPLVSILQPREESYPSGARDIVEAGLLETEDVRAVIAAHVQPTLPSGTVACTPGAVNASSDEITIIVEGRGGHAAYPHLTQDPVSTLAHVIVAAQTLISRNADPQSTLVLSITTLLAGAAANVIPDSALARGSVRAMTTAGRRGILLRLREVVELVAQAHGCTGRLEVTDGEPVLENSPELCEKSAPILQSLGMHIASDLRSAGSDDFSYYSERLPSLMMFVGVESAAGGLHSANFAPDDDAVTAVAHAMLAGYLAAADATLTDDSQPETGLRHAAYIGTDA
ncbi:M20 metallopeptidase family protein [Pseudarthrobacter albicanus]|uniref:M20 metallopeptidase family protein n=1 Tax=Pseudarthrobacter albicanus TaxID=2823873 RepID=UPI001BA47C6C|nr:M20 family metallopeptidase [Pseudarthrobacter albicanus]